MGGFSLTLGRVRVDALSEFGVNAYTGVGAALLSDDPGASGSVPFAGGRGALLVCVSCNSKTRSLWLGLAAHYNTDLYTEIKEYTYVETQSWFDEDPYQQPVVTSVEIGQTRVAVFATATFTFAL